MQGWATRKKMLRVRKTKDTNRRQCKGWYVPHLQPHYCAHRISHQVSWRNMCRKKEKKRRNERNARRASDHVSEAMREQQQREMICFVIEIPYIGVVWKNVSSTNHFSLHAHRAINALCYEQGTESVWVHLNPSRGTWSASS